MERRVRLLENEMETITSAIATAETDTKIAHRERGKGAKAKIEGKARDTCPWSGGMCEQWWLEGYDNQWLGIAGEVQAA